MEIKELKEKYLDSVQGSEKTKHLYGRRLSSFFIFLAGITGGTTAKKVEAVSELTAELTTEYQEQLKVSTNTKYLYLEQTKKFLKFLCQENYSFIDLSKTIQLPKWERKEKENLPIKKATKLIEGIKEPEPYASRNKAILALNLVEILKSVDIFKLTVLDLDLPNKELRIKRKKQFIKLKIETISYLKKYLRQRNKLKPKQDYLFLKQGGKQLSRQMLAKILREAKR